MSQRNNRLELEEGRIYDIPIYDYDLEAGNLMYKTPHIRKMRLIKKYQNFALFESLKGVRECFSYWALRKILNGEMVI